VVHRSTQPDLAYLAAEGAGAPLRHRLQLGATALQVVSGWSRVDGFLCLGSAERAWMESHAPWLGPRLHTYLHAPPAGLRPQLQEVARRRSAAPAGKTRWLWMGRWTAHKGTGALVQFLEERLARYPGESATLAGTGLRPELPPSLRGRVTVLPRYEREALPGLLASHDAGLFTSVAEGWGLSLQEMLEAGLPVYATHVGAAVDLAPYFPRSLRPFPPPGSAARIEPGGPPREDYDERFSWDVIASDAAVWLRTLSG
jgi:glycosyltransferase involved in cell wall biosynthesis